MGLQYKFDKIELGKFVKGIVDGLEVLALLKKLDYKFIPAPNEIFVNGDTMKLRQAVQNLVDNAIKYTNQGFVRTEVKVKGKSAVVSVSDSGIGISEKFSPHLFEEGAREDRAKQIAEGTGEGIYFARIIAQDHGGTILAQSNGEGQGSQFDLILPLATAS